MRSGPQTVGAVLLLLAFCQAAAVRGAILCEIKDGTLKVRDTVCFKHETQIDPVALGLQGPPGPQGIQGIPGPLAKLHAEIRTSSSPFDPNQGLQTFTASCLPGEVIIGVSTSGPVNVANASPQYEFDGTVWSFSMVSANIFAASGSAATNVVEIDLVCLSLQP